MTLHEAPAFDAALRLALAFLLALPPGWARERRARSPGLRAHPLLALCVCSFLLVALASVEDATEHADVYYGVLTGIGFVASGAIIKSSDRAVGMNSAVSLWLAGAIGAGVAYDIPLVSVALSLSSALSLWAPPFRSRRREEAR